MTTKQRELNKAFVKELQRWARATTDWFVCQANDNFTSSGLSWRSVYEGVHLKGATSEEYSIAQRQPFSILDTLHEQFPGLSPDTGWKLQNGFLRSPEGIVVTGIESSKLKGDTLNLPRVHPYGMRGWHLVHSLKGIPRGEMCRFYLPLHASKEGLIRLSEILDSADSTWTFKVRTTWNCNRPDRLVLYVASSDVLIFMDALERESADWKEENSQNLPEFCWHLAPGIGFALDNSRSSLKSFGQEISEVISKVLKEHIGVKPVDCGEIDRRGLEKDLVSAIIRYLSANELKV